MKYYCCRYNCAPVSVCQCQYVVLFWLNKSTLTVFKTSPEVTWHYLTWPDLTWPDWTDLTLYTYIYTWLYIIVSKLPSLPILSSQLCAWLLSTVLAVVVRSSGWLSSLSRYLRSTGAWTGLDWTVHILRSLHWATRELIRLEQLPAQGHHTGNDSRPGYWSRLLICSQANGSVSRNKMWRIKR